MFRNKGQKDQRQVTQTHSASGTARATISTRLSVKNLIGLVIVFCLAVLLPAGTALAQTANGSISGKVEDPQGASVPGAIVTAIDQLTNVQQTTQTNETGYFVFPEIRPGTYTLSVEVQGFEKFEKTDLVLLTADRLSAGTLQLKLGSTTTMVTVEAQSTPVQTASSEQSSIISSTEMAALPTIGNDYIALTRIIPGSTYLGEGNGSLGSGSSQASFMGIDEANAAYISTNGVFSSMSNVSNDGSPTVIANIQDVKILTSGYEPEYGKAVGAVINVTTKSGTKDYHGSLWYALRNEDLNANDFFSNLTGQPKSRYRYNTITGTLGGPVYIPGHFNQQRNKLFSFFSYDNEPSTVPQGLNYYQFPTARERQGDFSQSYIPGSSQVFPVLNPLTGQQYPGNVITNCSGANCPPIVPIMQQILNIFPQPNFTNTAVSQGFYNWVTPAVAHNPTDQDSLRLDYNPTEKMHVFGRWQRGYFGSTGLNEPGLYEGWVGPQSYDLAEERFELNATYTVNPHVVNELATGYSVTHEYNSFPASTLKAFQASALNINFPQEYPQTNPYDLIPGFGFYDLPYGPSYGYNDRFPMNDHYYGLSVADNLSYVYNNHQMKFGVYYDDEHQNQPHHLGNASPGGFFNLNGANPSNPHNVGYSFAEALLGYFDSYNAVTNSVDDSNTAKALQWYAQDNWQPIKRLAVNFGARFTYDIPQAITGGQGAAFEFKLYNAADAPPLFQPVNVNGTEMMKNPVNGQLYPAAYEDQFVPGIGNPAPGSVSVGTPDWHGLFNGKGLLVEPRLGFAYDLFGDGKTAIRGGIGEYTAMRTFSGTIYANIVVPPAIFYPTEYYGNVTTYASAQGVLGPSQTSAVDPNAGLPHSYSWSLGIQREVGFQSVLAVSYVGSVSKNIRYTINANEVPYGAEFLPQNQDPVSGTPLPDDYYRPYPGYNAISDAIWGDNANYNSLQVTFNRRMSHGLEYGVAYTWSKALDDRRSTTYLPGSLTYGPSSTNMANRLTPNFVWDLPKASRGWNNLFSRAVLDNWEVSGIDSFISGQPMNVGLATTDGENITGGGDGARVIVTGNAVLPKSQRTFDRFFNPNVFALPAVGTIGTAWNGSVFYGPGVNNWDLAVTKKIPFGEKVRTELRFEAYNAFNHTQFSSVNSTANFDPSTGAQVNSALGMLNGDRGPRIIQVGLRLNF